MINRSEKYFGAGQQANANSFPVSLSTEQEALLTTSAPAINSDAAGRTRVSQLLALFDGKVLNADEDSLFTNTGTGTALFGSNMVSLTVASGQYMIRQGKVFTQYFSGKSHVVESTFDNFQVETGVRKRVGYFSSNAVAPYDSNKDGFYLESDGVAGTYRLVVANNGTEKLNLAWTAWDNYAAISSYDWSKFTVTEIDFLWLGGAILRVFLKIGGEFVLAHTFNYAGTDTGTFMLSPNKPIRYEVRGVSGAGSLRYICSQIATEGSNLEVGKGQAFYNSTSRPTNSAGGTIYALKGLRKLATYRDIATQVLSCGVVSTSQNETGIVLLLLNPTLSAPFTWAPNGRVDEGDVASGTTITSTNYVIAAFPSYVSGQSNIMKESSITYLTQNLTDGMDAFVLAYRPATSNQSVHGIMNFRVF